MSDTTVTLHVTPPHFAHTAEGCTLGDCLCDHGFVCPYCGLEEPTSWLLANNHWVDVNREFEDPGSTFYWPRANGICIAQQLVRNQVGWSFKRLAEVEGKPAGKARDKELAQVRATLESDVVRAREVGIDVEAVRALLLPPLTCGRCRRGEHDDCLVVMWDTRKDESGRCGCEHERMAS